MASAPLALPVALAVLAAAYLALCARTDLRGWLLDRREARAAEASRTAPATAYGPLVRPVAPSPFPALRPLTDAERSELAGLDYWEHIMAAVGGLDLEDGRD